MSPQPVAETLRDLADAGWHGQIAAEVNTRKARSEDERMRLLRETLDFAREHTAVASEPVAEPA
mgnify:CR=1 FL=1